MKRERESGREGGREGGKEGGMEGEKGRERVLGSSVPFRLY